MSSIFKEASLARRSPQPRRTEIVGEIPLAGEASRLQLHQAASEPVQCSTSFLISGPVA